MGRRGRRVSPAASAPPSSGSQALTAVAVAEGCAVTASTARFIPSRPLSSGHAPGILELLLRTRADIRPVTAGRSEEPESRLRDYSPHVYPDVADSQARTR